MNEAWDWLFVIATGLVALHGLTFRDAEGEKDWVRLLFGCIALLFCLRTLFFDILEVL